MMWFLVAFLAIPVIEIALFIQVGGLIGLWPTLGLVLLTAVAGTLLVRSQGAQTLAELRRSMAELTDPSEPLAHGAMILFAGALLLTPGFFTDIIGFALLVPPVRLAAFRWLRRRIRIQGFPMGRAPGAARPMTDDSVIDGEFQELSPGKHPTHQPSGWTRH
jgi:UPF0716 protein FxsA